MKPTSNEIMVLRNAAESRFEVTVDGLLCVVDYVLQDGGMVLTHTYVPVELRGRGLAEKLVRAALEFARTEKRRVVPSCSYVDAFIARHTEFKPLLN